MILYVNNMYEVETVLDTYQDDNDRLHNNLLKLDHILCYLGDEVTPPPGTFSILLPDSGIFIFKYRLDDYPVEWVSRQYTQLNTYDFRKLRQHKPIFLTGAGSRENRDEVKKFLYQYL